MKTFFCLLLAAGLLLVTTVLILSSSSVLAEKRPPIYFATASGDTNKVAKYVTQNNDVNKPIVCYKYGHRYAPLLHIAVSNSQLDVVKLLLENGANPNHMDAQGETPLMAAIRGGRNDSPKEMRIRIIKALLDRGADPNLPAASGYNYPPIVEAAALGQADVLALLLDAGAHVQATNKIGQTALHLVKDTNTARLLVAAGSDPKARSADGETPAESARRLGNAQVEKLLANPLVPQQNR